MRLVNLLVFIVLVIVKFSTDSVSGNYVVTLKEFDAGVKNATDYVNLDGLKIKKKGRNETHKLYGSIIYYEGFRDGLYATGECFKKQGGEYRKLPYHLKGQFCDLLEMDKVFWPSFAAASGLPTKCPNEPGVCEFTNGWTPDASLFPPILESGDYRVDSSIWFDGKVVQSLKIYVHAHNVNGGRLGLK